MQEMIAFLEKEKQLRAQGLLADEIMGDYSLKINGERKVMGCYCGDCKHFKPMSREKGAYSIEGECKIKQQPGVILADTGRDCPQFKVRYAKDKNNKNRR